MTLQNKKKGKIELLAPARNIECGIEAIKHGADAVYIGGPSFGARSAAGNSIEDIKNVSGIGENKYEAIKDKISVK